MKMAVLGMGRMGRALAARLLDSGHEVTVWNRTPGRAPELLERGASEAATVADAAGAAALVATMLADDAAVREVSGGPDGIRDALAPDAVYVDCSTVSTTLTDELAAAFPRFAAMPVLGSPTQVAAGQAVYLVGADPAVAPAVEGLFPGLSEKRISYDRPALASAAKVAVNLLLLDGVVALAESFAVGRAGGLSDEQLRALLGDSPMVAPGLKYRFDGILTGEQEPMWTNRLGAKDAGLAVDLAAAAGVDLPATATARDAYRRADGDADIATVTRRYRR